MSYIKVSGRDQISFLPECLEDYVSENNIVRVIDAFVNALNLVVLGFTKAVASNNCRPCYDPRDLLKLYIYGYLNHIRSSRRLMTECGRNIEVMWLLNKLCPDFRTIADFRKDNKTAFKKVFREFVQLCDSLNLCSKELVSIDGSKFKAVNSKDNNFTRGKLEDRIALIDKHIEEYFAELNKADAADTSDKNDKVLSKQVIEEKVKELKARKGQYEGYLDIMNTTGVTQISTTDPESRLMQNNGKLDVCYNVQTAVDAKHHLIVDFVVTNDPADNGLIKLVADGVKEALSLEVIETLNDAGYDNKHDIKDCLLSGTYPNVAFSMKEQEEHVILLEYCEKEISEEVKNSNKAEDITTCLKAGIVPTVYANKNICLDVIDEYDEPKYMLCPNGYTLGAKKSTKNTQRFASEGACKRCNNRCIKVKQISQGKNKSKRVVKVLTRPKDKSQSRVVVRLRIRPDKEKLKQRMCLSEHPFGTIKFWNDSSYLLTKGKVKATAELAMSFLAYNLKRVMNILGFDLLIEAIKTLIFIIFSKILKTTKKAVKSVI